MQSEAQAENEHSDIDNLINKEDQEILRRPLQGWLDLKAVHEEKIVSIQSASGDKLNHVRVGTRRPLNSLFGQVTATRKGYSQIRKASVFPLDAQLNLSSHSYSDGIYYRVSNEASIGPF